MLSFHWISLVDDVAGASPKSTFEQKTRDQKCCGSNQDIKKNEPNWNGEIEGRVKLENPECKEAGGNPTDRKSSPHKIKKYSVEHSGQFRSRQPFGHENPQTLLQARQLGGDQKPNKCQSRN